MVHSNPAHSSVTLLCSVGGFIFDAFGLPFGFISVRITKISVSHLLASARLYTYFQIVRLINHVGLRVFPYEAYRLIVISGT